MHPADTRARCGSSDRPSLRPGVSVVVPCYHSERSLERLVAELGDVLGRQPLDFEAILVNDGSRDGTWETICRLAAAHSWVRGIDLMRNYGQHNATLCGTRAARFDVTITLDDDLQHPPSEIPKLLEQLAEGQDVVYGTPLRMPHSLYRNLASWATKYAITIATGQRTVRELAAFRCFRTKLREAFDDYRSPELILDVLLGWGTTRISSVPVMHDVRKMGESNYGLRQLLSAMLLLWIGYTTGPLRFAVWIGFFFVLFGAGVLTYVVGTYVRLGSLPGFPFLASTIAIFGGVQLFTLGVIGQYLVRLFHRSLERPLYVVKEATASPVENADPVP